MKFEVGQNVVREGGRHRWKSQPMLLPSDGFSPQIRRDMQQDADMLLTPKKITMT